MLCVRIMVRSEFYHKIIIRNIYMNTDYIFVQQKEGIHLIPNAYIIARVYCHSMKSVVGVSFGPTLVEYRDGIMYWYASEKEMKKVSQVGFELVRKDPRILKKIIKTYRRFMSPLTRHAQRVSEQNLNRCTGKELWDMWEKYMKYYEQAYSWSEPVVLSLSDSLGSYLRTYLEQVISNKTELALTYSVLTAPCEKSFAKKEEEALLRLALKIHCKQIKNVELAIQKHVQMFGWIPYDYGLQIWDTVYFSKLLEHMIKQDDIETKLKNSKKYFLELPKQQRMLEKKYKIDKEHKRLFETLRTATYLQDYKKELFTLAHVRISRLFDECAKRFSTERMLVQYYLPEELKNALCNGELLPGKELRARSTQSLFIFEVSGVKMITGKESRDFVQKHLKKDEASSHVLSGITASAGSYTGSVRIVRGVEDIKNVRKGDVLVASMTSPEYVPAMRIAGAVITDQGGIMCHAAILSRELGIPCLVGTQSATRVLKDGDIVELHADHNSVKVISKK